MPDLEIDWLAQHPVTKVLEGEGERIHPLIAELANESRHSESESAEDDLHCFQAWNASYGALPYKDKRPHYNSQNLLARTLTDESYDHNPKFLGYRERSGLPFESVAEFGKDARQGRQALYRDLAAEVWSLERFGLMRSASAGAAAA